MGVYDWQNVAGNAALSRHWSVFADNFNTGGESLGPVYAQQRPNVITHPSDWTIRLDETKLPFISRLTRLVEMGALIPRYRSSQTSRVIEVGGKTIRFWDARFAGGGSGVPFNVEAWTSPIVRNGRELPISRMRARAFHPYFGVEQGVNYASYTEPLGSGGHRCVLTQHVPLYAMHLPRTDGSTTLDGVYMAWRPIIARAIEPEGGAAFDYKEMVLPDLHVFEIGTLASGVTTARDKVVIDGKAFVVDAGLARERIGDTSGTHFCCAVLAGGTSVLQFAHAVADRDATVCGIISPTGPWEEDRNTNRPQFSIAYIIGLMAAPQTGECPAFEWISTDCGKLVHVTHAAGAATTPPFPSQGNPQIDNELPQSSEWGSWPNSLYPYTAHVNAVQTLEGPRSIHDDLPGLRKKTPIYALRQYPGFWQSVEPYPQREVFARMASLQNWAHADCMSPYSSESANLLRKNENDAMVICGKRVNNVTIKFEPYEPASVPNVPAGLEPNPASENISFPLVGYLTPSADGWVGAGGNQAFWWKETGSLPRPPGAVLTFPAQSALKQGRATWNTGVASRRVATQTVPAGDVDPELEKLIVSTPLCRIGSLGTAGRSGQAQAVDAFVNADISLRLAPLTGEYELGRFSVGNVAAAGYLFRCSQAGDWNVEQVFDYTLNLPGISINDTWEPGVTDGWWYGKEDRTNATRIVPVTETWNLSTDHIELYCALSTVLQEAGTYDPDLSFGFDDTRDSIYRNHLVFDQPKGRIASVITYTEGNEPRPALKIVLNARSAMRATLTMDVDTSGIPDNYPWSLSDAGSDKIAAKVSGTAGTGNISGAQQTKNQEHILRTFEHQFTADETESLLAGESVVATAWDQPGGSPDEPHVFDYGSQNLLGNAMPGTARRYKVTCTLDVEEV